RGVLCLQFLGGFLVFGFLCCPHLRGERGVGPVQRGKLLLEIGGGFFVRGFADDRQVFGHGRTCENTVQRIVIRRRDGIELVVVATGTGNGQAKECLGRGVDAVVDDVVLIVHEPLA